MQHSQRSLSRPHRVLEERPGFALVRGASLSAAVIALSLLAGCKDEPTTDRPLAVLPAPQVSVVTLSPQSVAVTAELPGRVAASLVAEVRPQVNGIIEQRLFQEGSEVNAGDPLYQIDAASYLAAYASAEAALQRAKASLPGAQAKVTRYRRLAKQDAVSRQDLDDAVRVLAQAEADIAAAEAAVEKARIDLDNTTITAPISGRIDRSSLTPGALVSASQGAPLTTIRRIDPVNVDVTRSSTSFLDFREAVASGALTTSDGAISVTLKLDNGSLYPHAGTLEFAEAHVDPNTGTYTLRAQFPNPDRLLLPGMYVRAVIPEGVAENVFLVPQRAVSRNRKGQPTAFFVKADGTVDERVLDIRRSVGNNWLVSAGVEPGDRVIVEGLQSVRSGIKVEVREVTIDEGTGEAVPGVPGPAETQADGSKDAAAHAKN